MQTDPLAEIEAAASAAGVSIADALSEAGVASTTWWRWKEERFDPRLGTLRRIREAIERRREAA